jgi:hypothetical protein
MVFLLFFTVAGAAVLRQQRPHLALKKFNARGVGFGGGKPRGDTDGRNPTQPK